MLHPLSTHPPFWFQLILMGFNWPHLKHAHCILCRKCALVSFRLTHSVSFVWLFMFCLFCFALMFLKLWDRFDLLKSLYWLVFVWMAPRNYRFFLKLLFILKIKWREIAITLEVNMSIIPNWQNIKISALA